MDVKELSYPDASAERRTTLIVVTGPTGVGKTELCLDIALHLQVPIINADSRQIYAELPIGTAAPTRRQTDIVKHYFVGTLKLTDYYSAAMYESDVVSLLERLFAESDVALLAGGSMMYIDAVCDGIDDIPTVPDDVRQQMRLRLEREGLDALCNELREIDPEYYAIVDLHNPRRVVHALEICHTAGQTYTSLRKNTRKERPFRLLKIGLTRPRDELYKRIDNRVDCMIQAGLVDEARAVYPMRGLNALNTVGYKELFACFDGQLTLDEAIQRIKSSTRRYCRKQLTWLKKDERTTWFNPDDKQSVIQYIDDNI